MLKTACCVCDNAIDEGVAQHRSLGVAVCAYADHCMACRYSHPPTQQNTFLPEQTHTHAGHKGAAPQHPQTASHTRRRWGVELHSPTIYTPMDASACCNCLGRCLLHTRVWCSDMPQHPSPGHLLSVWQRRTAIPGPGTAA
jgi:hypothetical protein